MDRALLDTDILSEILKGVDRAIVTRAVAYRAIWGRYTTSVITVIEIVKGLHKIRREGKIKQFLDGLSTAELLTLDLQSAEFLSFRRSPSERFRRRSASR